MHNWLCSLGPLYEAHYRNVNHCYYTWSFGLQESKCLVLEIMVLKGKCYLKLKFSTVELPNHLGPDPATLTHIELCCPPQRALWILPFWFQWNYLRKKMLLLKNNCGGIRPLAWSTTQHEYRCHSTTLEWNWPRSRPAWLCRGLK